MLQTHLGNHCETYLSSTALSFGDAHITYAQLFTQTPPRVKSKTENPIYCLLAQRNIDCASALVAGLNIGLTLAILDPRQSVERTQGCVQGYDCVWLADDANMSVASSLSNGPVININNLPTEDPATAISNEEDVKPDKIGSPILFTSGSTGKPKGVVIEPEDLLVRLKTEQEWFNLSSNDVILGVLPFSFDVGLTQLLGSVYSGAHFRILNSWFPKDIIREVTEHKVTGLAMSPMVWKTLLKYSNQNELWNTLNTLRYLTLSGGDLDPTSLKTIITQLSGPTFYKTYGQSEFFRISSFKANLRPDKILTVGQAYPGVTIQIVDDSGKPCPVGVEGEIVAFGAGRMQGYLGQTALNNPLTASDPHKTGDLGFLDEEGFLTVCGRKDDMIKILDQRVFPAEIAHAIDAALNITGCEVIAVRKEDSYGLVAFICELSPAFSEKAYLRNLRQKLSSHMVPSRIICLDSWPTTLSGKVDKPTLKKTAVEVIDLPPQS